MESRATVRGFGYWSGIDVCVEFRPAPPDSGIVFVRHDLASPVRIPALVANRIETPRRTSLSKDGATIEMVEHILAALAGLGIDNCEVWVDQTEMPGCDGSSQQFVDALQVAGLVAQDALRQQLIVRQVTRLGDSEYWIEAQPSQDGTTTIRYRLDYAAATPAIGRQTAEFSLDREVFCRELASCRTFMLDQEAKWLLSQGFGQRVQPSDVLVFDQEGPIENELRYEDECVRHKILDIVGDLSLAGCRIVGKIVAHRSGHRLNAELVKALLNEAVEMEPRRLSA
ncbi:MAG: UDP-3-O-[3-hydroxymyristoyl] N-acetylglucosamine deacetylase [Planctomycetales bacterium]|nr:UDP-3-O-[3-hydroxymyristoyl] N-acetylglucosamine deacetylase [Planctomycetales bacterium]NIM09661.1 UDP-3-O-[3-hydroxymyristoyl] N-acetylglucosamine deacetylase [Planctomycetales bacterium]NIN09144.1 UDP-3-O-[3-hydroxymyristoyl] N-acetylglucosamine deacetylase [Planctomycetales bacterium]NIN78251.1 UDP-3-O-[3-hydroxymyristoyl] N-acetylglucosamine deacetylase [Planctomycetales bacterium]NIO35442.1 UDP-3-O-[3-hydroxymyristoyl] N-acetylglucosamine deacetylase [Planctomycetales bacterium]